MDQARLAELVEQMDTLLALDDFDVFVHVEVLRRSGLADLTSGEAVSLRIIEGKRGRMAVAVMPWDAGIAREAVRVVPPLREPGRGPDLSVRKVAVQR